MIPTFLEMGISLVSRGNNQDSHPCRTESFAPDVACSLLGLEQPAMSCHETLHSREHPTAQQDRREAGPPLIMRPTAALCFANIERMKDQARPSLKPQLLSLLHYLLQFHRIKCAAISFEMAQTILHLLKSLPDANVQWPYVKCLAFVMSHSETALYVQIEAELSSSKCTRPGGGCREDEELGFLDAEKARPAPMQSPSGDPEPY